LHPRPAGCPNPEIPAPPRVRASRRDALRPRRVSRSVRFAGEFHALHGSGRALACQCRRLTAADAPATPLSVAELLLRYLEYAERHYAGRRAVDALLAKIKTALRPVRELYGSQPAASFDAKALMLVRQRYIDAGHNRDTVNAKIGVVKRCFRWAAREELIDASAYHALTTLDGLRRGGAAVPEAKPVLPVADEAIEAVLPCLSRQVRGLVQLQRYSGMRPGEAVTIRGIDIDRSEGVWFYRPEHHKSDLQGKTRVIALGPHAQAAVMPFLRPGYLFSPADEERERLAARQAARRTPMHVGNRPGTNRRQHRRRPPADRYTVRTYAQAIERACLKVWPVAGSGPASGGSSTEPSSRMKNRPWWPQASGVGLVAFFQSARRMSPYGPYAHCASVTPFGLATPMT